MVKVLAIIPARGGSKGIPRKNIRSFAGYPLVAYSIAASLQAKTVSRTIVSTEDEEIAKISRQFGAEVPFQRPAELAQDNSTDLPVFVHALQWLDEHEGFKPDIVVHLRPTSPIRPVDCVDNAVRILLDHPEVDCVRGVVPAGQNPYKMWRIEPGSGRMVPLLGVPGLDEPYNAPRQVLPAVYWQTGHIDAIRSSTILGKGSMTGDIIFPITIDPRFTVDLDTPSDWAKAEWLVTNGRLDFVTPGKSPRPMPKRIELLVMDFDGVLTDNRVWTDPDGREMVASNRSDSYGLGLLRTSGIESVVISKETNPVVSTRCKKIGIPVLQGIDDKEAALRGLLEKRGIDPACVVYIGTDINDLTCFHLVGWAVTVPDAMPEAIRQADYVLSHNGGHGAVRELCDLILQYKRG